jgi:hypothetical protein
VNTTPDDLQQQNLLSLLAKVEPSWKLNQIPPNPATEVYSKPAEPRRAHFSINAPFGSVEATGGSGGSGGGSTNLIPVTVSGVFNGTPVTGIAAYFQSPS